MMLAQRRQPGGVSGSALQLAAEQRRGWQPPLGHLASRSAAQRQAAAAGRRATCSWEQMRCARWQLTEKMAAPRPKAQSLASCTASSSLWKQVMLMTGPNTWPAQHTQDWWLHAPWAACHFHERSPAECGGHRLQAAQQGHRLHPDAAGARRYAASSGRHARSRRRAHLFMPDGHARRDAHEHGGPKEVALGTLQGLQRAAAR